MHSRLLDELLVGVRLDPHQRQALALRTAKADVVVGLAAGAAEDAAALDAQWMVGGEWGMVQFVEP